MANVNKPYTFTNGQTADATQVNQDFDTLYTVVDGNIDSANLKDGSIATVDIATEAVTPAKTEGIPYSTDLYGTTGFVQSGLTATKDGTTLSQVNITTGIIHVAQADGTLRRFAPIATNFRTTAASVTYYLDFNPDGTWSWNISHSTQTNYVTIATVTSDAGSNVNVVTDTRPTTITFMPSTSLSTWGLTARTQGLMIVPLGTVTDNGAGVVTFGSNVEIINPAAGSYIDIAAGSYTLGLSSYLYVDLPPTTTRSTTITPSVGTWVNGDRNYDNKDRIVLAQRANTGVIYFNFKLPAASTTLTAPATVLSGGYKLQSGTVAAAAVGNYTVTFPTAFSTVPVVIPGIFTGANASMSSIVITAVSATSVTFYVPSAVPGAVLHWHAIGS